MTGDTVSSIRYIYMFYSMWTMYQCSKLNGQMGKVWTNVLLTFCHIVVNGYSTKFSVKLKVISDYYELVKR